MDLKRIFIHCTIFLSCVSLSCNKYIDSVHNKNDAMPKNLGYLKVYPDSNVFLYKTKIVLTKDTEEAYPRSFKVTLPKGLKDYEVLGSTDFTFYNKNSQTIFIRIDLDKGSKVGKKSYVPSINDIDDLIQSKLTLSKSKYDIKEIPLITKAKNLMIKDGGVTILLYNIDPRQFDLFEKDIRSFSWMTK